MNRKNTISLYDKYKNTPKKLKIICDWDEVIQPCEPYALWKAWGKATKYNGLKFKHEWIVSGFSGFANDFWSKEYCSISYFPYGSKLATRQEREDKKEEFWCSICGIKYREELLGGETIQEGKICRWCLEKKKKEEK